MAALVTLKVGSKGHVPLNGMRLVSLTPATLKITLGPKGADVEAMAAGPAGVQLQIHPDLVVQLALDIVP